MNVKNALPCGFTNVNADIESVGIKTFRQYFFATVKR